MVVVAPGRARRPGAFFGAIEPPSDQELESCPFCEGREDRTPPETLALGRPEGSPPDSPGWKVRVVPNLYPAFERQEVVIHSPRHARSFADLTHEQIRLIAEAWRLRNEQARTEGFGYLHALINEGRAAGASLPHGHSQLVWMRETPPLVAAEHQDALDELLARQDLVVAERSVESPGDVVALAHPAGRAPYELVIAPRASHAVAFDDGDLLVAALDLLADVMRRVRLTEGPVPWNAWVHQDRHWHVEVVPRLTVFAGVELGAGIYVNTLAPEDAARALREAVVS
jgi:UDPglucose--hexose-1-phosphate uridylyltransferase